MHLQILYKGKTDKCHPAAQFPEGWDVLHTANYWLNEASMIQYLNKIVILFLKPQ